MKVVINGVVWQEGNKILPDKSFKEYRKKPVTVMARLMDAPFEVETLEGTMKGDKGDFLIIGVQGEAYPCKPDIFQATYEGVRP